MYSISKDEGSDRSRCTRWRWVVDRETWHVWRAGAETKYEWPYNTFRAFPPEFSLRVVSFGRDEEAGAETIGTIGTHRSAQTQPRPSRWAETRETVSPLAAHRWLHHTLACMPAANGRVCCPPCCIQASMALPDRGRLHVPASESPVPPPRTPQPPSYGKLLQ
jgi:hypothetical protein